MSGARYHLSMEVADGSEVVYLPAVVNELDSIGLSIVAKPQVHPDGTYDVDNIDVIVQGAGSSIPGLMDLLAITLEMVKSGWEAEGGGGWEAPTPSGPTVVTPTISVKDQEAQTDG